jgi:hypothetical protein
MQDNIHDTRNIFYWNCADDRDHTHKRIEWAIENGMLVCINIKILDTLFSKVNIGDIILAYEPKEHKISKKQYDGFCISCKNKKTDGRQAFTNVFQITNQPIKWINFQEEFTANINIIGSWINPAKKINDNDIIEYKKYSQHYYSQKNIKYIFPVKFICKLDKPISTSSKLLTNELYYYNKPIVKGFNEIFTCGCNNISKCNNNLCIHYHIHNDKNFI